jgi:hypothetical protein
LLFQVIICSFWWPRFFKMPPPQPQNPLHTGPTKLFFSRWDNNEASTSLSDVACCSFSKLLICFRCLSSEFHTTKPNSFLQPLQLFVSKCLEHHVAIAKQHICNDLVAP